MPEEYAHTLIPERLDCVPEPDHVAAFLNRLAELGAVPLEAKLKVMKPSGKFRTGFNPVTKETLSFPISEHMPLQEIADLSTALAGLEHYNVILSGQGPPRLQPCQLVVVSDTEPWYDCNDSYAFDVVCCLREKLVSTSEVVDDDARSARGLPFFGEPWTSHDRTGVFQHPGTWEIVEVQNAGCARFWLEFSFGKWLIPKMSDGFNVLEPSIVATAEEHFGTKFVQAYHWVG